MIRRVERQLLDEWIDRNGPDGISELAIASRVSASLIAKIRIGCVPKKEITRMKLCRAIEVTEDELFPVLPDGEDKAS